MKRFVPVLATALLFSAVGFFNCPANADTLLIKRTDQAHSSAVPKRGASMSQVSAQYGVPSTKHGAIGKPPITRWDYPAFSVYFEYSHVVDTVLKQASEGEMGVKPVVQPTR
jgi:hypothetical protein